ncbi:MAG: LCP family protein [Eubacteriales bacterium]|nr:LCP family protein [Eubacteriales bacterium]
MGNKHPNNENNPAKKKSSGFAKFLIIMGVLLVLAAAGVLGVTVYNYTMISMAANKPTVPTLPPETVAVTEAVQEETVPLQSTEETVPETTELPYTPSGQDIINVMLVGQSYREDEQNYLSDSNILVTINKATKTATLTSFLRDTYVDLADFDFTKEDGKRIQKSCGFNRINTAYALGYSWGGQAGAMKMMNDTIKVNFGVDVDYNVEVDFDGFINAINVIGEIPMDLTEDEAAYINKTLNKALGYEAYDYRAVYDDGSTTTYMSGWECLTYARMRHSSSADNDFKRTERQRKLIAAILGELKDTDFKTLTEFAQTILQQISTNMTDDEILTCMWEVLPLLPELKIEGQQVPTEGSYSGKTVMIGDVETTAMDITWNTKNRDMIMAYAEADTLVAQAQTEPQAQAVG